MVPALQPGGRPCRPRDVSSRIGSHLVSVKLVFWPNGQRNPRVNLFPRGHSVTVELRLLHQNSYNPSRLFQTRHKSHGEILLPHCQHHLSIRESKSRFFGFDKLQSVSRFLLEYPSRRKAYPRV